MLLEKVRVGFRKKGARGLVRWVARKNDSGLDLWKGVCDGDFFRAKTFRRVNVDLRCGLRYKENAGVLLVFARSPVNGG